MSRMQHGVVKQPKQRACCATLLASLLEKQAKTTARVVSHAPLLSVDTAWQQAAQQQRPSLFRAAAQVMWCAAASELVPACVAGRRQQQRVPAAGAGGLLWPATRMWALPAGLLRPAVAQAMQQVGFVHGSGEKAVVQGL